MNLFKMLQYRSRSLTAYLTIECMSVLLDINTLPTTIRSYLANGGSECIIFQLIGLPSTGPNKFSFSIAITVISLKFTIQSVLKLEF